VKYESEIQRSSIAGRFLSSVTFNAILDESSCEICKLFKEGALHGVIMPSNYNGYGLDN
jgi:hypothetical protein